MRVLAALVLAVLAGCAGHTGPGDLPADSTTDLSACCALAVPFSPAALENLATVLPALTPMGRDMALRPGHLARHPEALAALADEVQPLDILMVSTRQHLTGNVLPGYFNHAALVLGSEADLRALGLWSDPAILPLREAVRAGGTLAIEASGAAVAPVPLARLADADGIAVLRPAGLARAERRAAVLRLTGHIGTPFDFRFDMATPGCLFCTELVDVTLPGLSLPRREVAGRQTIVPDDVARLALDGGALGLAAFLYADRKDWHRGDAALLSASIAANWPATPGADP